MDIRSGLRAAVDSVAQVDDSAVLGEGTLVRGEVTIGAGVRVGSCCLIEGLPDRKTMIGGGTCLEDFVKVHPGVVIGEESRVESYTILGHPSKARLIGHDGAAACERVTDLLVHESVTRIGPGSLVRSHSVIYTNVIVGEGFSSGHGIMVREHTRIGSHCIFGTHASVDGYCVIGDRCQIGQYAQLSQAARIGRGIFVGGHTVFSDNKKAVREIACDLIGATVEDYARIGLNCTILSAVVIGEKAFVGAGSVVTQDVAPSTLVYGSPARVSRMLTSQEAQEYVNSVER